MTTQAVTTRPGPKSRVERMHDHANRLRTGPCARDRHWYIPVGADMRCERCDEEAPHFERVNHRCVILGIDPATADQPPVVVTLVDGAPLQIERAHPPTPWVDTDTALCGHELFWWAGDTCMVCGPRRKPRPYIRRALEQTREEIRARFTEAFRSAAADGRLFPFPDELEPIDLTAPPTPFLPPRSLAVEMTKAELGWFTNPAANIHPNGGIPG